VPRTGSGSGGNNADTFKHYPVESIDVSTRVALAALSEQDRAEWAALGTNDAVVDRWFFQKGGVVFIQQHPWLALHHGFLKIRAAFS
jgi:hypothetical protein